MKKYLYLWIEKYRRLNEMNENDGYLFENLGMNLSSQYLIEHVWQNGKLQLKCCDNPNYEKYFYSKHLADIKVFVGNNGAGKTTLLLTLYQLITAGLGTKPFGMGHFALAYIEDNGAFCVTTSLTNIEIPSGWNFFSEESRYHTASRSIRYTASFDDQECKIDEMVLNGDFNGSNDVSTGALLVNDKENLNNLKSNVDYEFELDSLQCYYKCEENRKIDFLIDSLKAQKSEFWLDFNLPKKMKMELMDANLKNAFAEIAHYLIENESIGNIVKDNLQYLNENDYNEWEGLENETEDCYEFWQDDDRRRFAKAIVKSYCNYFDKLLITDKFRFAVIMSCVRTYGENTFGDTIDSLYTLVSLSNFPKASEDHKVPALLKNMKLWEDPRLIEGKNGIEKIISIFDGCVESTNGFASYENHFMGNGVVYFDLNQHLYALSEINDTYNSFLKTAPFISFGFIRPLSSGESATIKLYYRLYYALKNQTNNQIESNFYLFLDEIDLYLHPEWQRQWLMKFRDGLSYIERMLVAQGVWSESQKLRAQVFLTTHSPFMLTDFLTDNVVLLKRESPLTKTVVEKYQSENIFGANIYSLIQSGFFLENSVGCLFESKIRNLLSQEKKDSIKDLDKNLIYSQIGDPIIKGLVRDSISWSDANDSREN